MSENNNIASKNNDLVQKLLKRFDKVKKGCYTNNEKGSKLLCP